ncbi:hypothetical protein GE061_008552 [Apolygus lucorum]|uniref:Uncharacterized protein n=1 Tax=Apolygus lucorum TaxID=248454 RepID=A0A6A4IIZ5_APOLU|nr:hypothetical protein GE061_008552 [Apolygus lucorum]
MAGEVSTVSKPELRGLLRSAIKKNLIIAIGLSIIGGIGYQTLICNPRKQRYADFYKNYDAEKEFQRMKAAGLFQSVAQVEAYEERMKLQEEAAVARH